MDGFVEGCELGFRDGKTDGFIVGKRDGKKVGEIVGKDVGFNEVNTVGIFVVDSCVGSVIIIVGGMEGKIVGKIEGFSDGSIIVSDNTRARFVDGDRIGQDVGA
jgi:hypothetical protein